MTECFISARFNYHKKCRKDEVLPAHITSFSNKFLAIRWFLKIILRIRRVNNLRHHKNYVGISFRKLPKYYIN